MSYGSFEDLEVWKRGCRLTVRVYEVLNGRNWDRRIMLTKPNVGSKFDVRQNKKLCWDVVDPARCLWGWDNGLYWNTGILVCWNKNYTNILE